MSWSASGTHTRIVALALLFVAPGAGRLAAAERAVVLSGSWSETSTWSGGVVPGVNDNAFVGSTTPSGALTSATVTLTQNVTAGNVYLGHNNGTSGTLQLGDFTFTGKDLYFGFVGTGSITRTTGHLDVLKFDIRNGNTFTLASSDIVRNILGVYSGSSLTLGANLTVSDKIDLANSNTVLNAQGFNIQATNEILLGWNGVGAQIQNRGNLTTGRLAVRGQNFDLTATDAVGHFIMRQGTTSLGSGVAVSRLDLTESATGTTTATGNVTSHVLVESGSSLTLGANLSLSDWLNIRGNGTILNAGGHNIVATNQILIGWDGGSPTLQNRGTLTTANLLVRGQDFQLTAADAVGRFWLSEGDTNLGAGVAVNRLDLSNGATATTAETGNVAGFVQVESGSTLTLGANLTLSDKLNLRGSGTVLNANGKDISATNQILIGWDAVGPALQNRGKLTSNELLVRGQNFQLTPTDAINNFYMDNGTTNLGAGVVVQRLILTSNATATTVASGNVTKSVTLQTGSTLTLGASLTLTENLNLSGAGTVLNANGHAISTPNQFLFGWDSTGTPVLQNVGTVTVGELLQRNGTQLSLASGADATGRVYLQGNSHLTASVSGAGTGLTLTRSQTSELDIQAGSRLTFALDGDQAGWVFRWANPTGGDHVADLNTLIAQGKIDFALQDGAGFAIASNTDGYTYVTMSPVPEPASVLALCAVAAVVVMGVKRSRNPRPAPTST